MLRRLVLFFYLLWLRISTMRSYAHAFALVLLLVLVWGTGYWTGQREYFALAQAVEQVGNRLGILWHDESPAVRLAVMEKDALLTAQTIKGIKEELYQKEREIADLTEEVYFYRSVVAPEDNLPAVDIFSLRLGRLDGDRAYWVDLVVRRTTDNTVVKGRVALFLRGWRDGEEQTLDASLALDNEGRLSFKYFQRLEGRLYLPERFNPEWVLVRVENKKLGNVEKTYRWSDLLPVAASHN